MTPQHMIALGVIVGAVVRVLKGETFNVPKSVLPWLALLLGFGGAAAESLQAGSTLAAALSVGLSGLFAGAAAVAGNETLGNVSPKVIGPKAAKAIFGKVST